ncbi:MAG: 2-oxoacid:acceptor oxidoreductase family protein [Thaumarchaeota archaeon]|nr:2-oxoacid:acceptor oxidoreductase family protein [Nitrososphaerota archaeon]
MYEIRWHGRGGQGVVTAAELLADAVVEEGRFAQAFPFFGPERRGSPVSAFTRVDQEPIELVSRVYEPDAVVVLDHRLLHQENVVEGLKPGGALILNAPEGFSVLDKTIGECTITSVDATAIAVKRIGVPLANTTILGAVVKATGTVGLESVERVVLRKFDAQNAEAVREGFHLAYRVEN